MPTPFPGMDPYLEGYLWPDVHHRLATEIARRLMPRIRPRYVARLEIYVVEDENPEVEIGIMYPDVEVVAVQERVAPSRGILTAYGLFTCKTRFPFCQCRYVHPTQMYLWHWVQHYKPFMMKLLMIFRSITSSCLHPLICRLRKRPGYASCSRPGHRDYCYGVSNIMSSEGR